MHPLVTDLTGLSDDELSSKQSEIVSRISQAYSFGNQQMVHQLQLLQQDYALEAEKRNKKLLDQMQKGKKESDDDSAKDITR